VCAYAFVCVVIYLVLDLSNVSWGSNRGAERGGVWGGGDYPLPRLLSKWCTLLYSETINLKFFSL